jgi:hypothetical protein
MKAALDAQLVQMLRVLPRGELRSEYENVSAAAKHMTTLLNRLTFKLPNPVFTWVSAAGTTWSAKKLKHNSSRCLAIALWKDGWLRLVNEPVNNHQQVSESQPAETPTSASASVNEPVNEVSESQPANTSTSAGPSVNAESSPDSDDYGTFPTLGEILEQESASAPMSSKRKGKQPAFSFKAPKTQGNQDISKYFERTGKSWNRMTKLAVLIH